MTQQLSPAAQAVRSAYHEICEDYVEAWLSFKHNRGLAAVLRAAADQVVPKESTKGKMFAWQHERLAQRLMTRDRLLAIAAELENTNA